MPEAGPSPNTRTSDVHSMLQAVVAMGHQQGLEYHGGGPGRDEFYLPTVGGGARSMLLDGRKRALSEVRVR